MEGSTCIAEINTFPRSPTAECFGSLSCNASNWGARLLGLARQGHNESSINLAEEKSDGSYGIHRSRSASLTILALFTLESSLAQPR